jgi:hypothetical protein
MRACDPRLVGADARLAREAEDRVVPRAEPSAAAVDGRPVREALRPDAAADAIARLEHDDRPPRLAEPMRGGEPGVSRADDADVALESLAHGATP